MLTFGKSTGLAAGQAGLAAATSSMSCRLVLLGSAAATAAAGACVPPAPSSARPAAAPAASSRRRRGRARGVLPLLLLLPPLPLLLLVEVAGSSCGVGACGCATPMQSIALPSSWAHAAVTRLSRCLLAARWRKVIGGGRRAGGTAGAGSARASIVWRLVETNGDAIKVGLLLLSFEPTPGRRGCGHWRCATRAAWLAKRWVECPTAEQAVEKAQQGVARGGLCAPRFGGGA